MTTINDIKELKSLAFGEKFYVISEGSIKSYLYAGQHPRVETLCIAIWDADYTTAKVFSNRIFSSSNTVILQGEYISEIVGNIMVSHYQNRIETIEKIYLKKDTLTNQ